MRNCSRRAPYWLRRELSIHLTNSLWEWKILVPLSSTETSTALLRNVEPVSATTAFSLKSVVKKLQQKIELEQVFNPRQGSQLN